MKEALTKTAFFSSKDFILFYFVTFLSYACYLITAFPTVTTEDSGEFSAAIYHLGIAHPSGYPLYVILGKIFTLLVPFGDLAWKVNVFSAFCSAIAVGLLYLLLKKITTNTIIASVTALFFASGGLFWSQAIRAEVYGLNTACMLGIMLLAYLWFEKTEKRDFRTAHKLLFWLTFLYGLSIGNHHLMLMMGPPLALFILLVQPKMLFDFRVLTKAIGFFLLGLSIYLFLPFRASYQPVINWGNPITWQSFWDHVTRKIYSVDQLNPLYQPVNTVSSIAPQPNFFVKQGNFLQKFFFILHEQYTFVPAILAIFGFIFAWLRSKKFFIFLLSLFIFYGSILSISIDLGHPDKLPLALFTERPFYLSLLLLTVFSAGLGGKYLVDFFTRHKTFSPRIRTGAFVISVLSASLWLFLQIPANNQSDNYIAYDLAKNSLFSLPQNAVLHSENGDNTLFPILYLQTVENFRLDVKVYMNMPNSVYPFFESLEKMEGENPGRPLFTDFPFVYYPHKSYRCQGPFSEIISGTGLTTFCEVKDGMPFSEEDIRGWAKKNLDHFHLYLKARFYLDRGLATLDPTTQEIFFEQAFDGAPESQNITGQLIGNYFLRSQKYVQAIPYLRRAHDFMPQEYSINFQLTLAFIMSDQFDEAKQHLTQMPSEDKNLLLKEFTTLATQPAYQKIRSFLMTNERNFE